MKVLCVLLIILSVQSCVMANNGNGPQKCCFQFYNKPVPVAYIRTYEDTRPDCTRAGVIFTTRKGSEVCVDPGFQWVKRALNKLDRQKMFGKV